MSDSSNPRPGETTTTFTLYCVGPRGVLTEVPWWKASVVPVGIVVASVLGVPVLIFVAGLVRGIGRRIRGRGSDDDDGIPSGGPIIG